MDDAAALTPFAVVYRYEDLDLGDAPDLDEVLDVARRVHDRALSVDGLETES